MAATHAVITVVHQVLRLQGFAQHDGRVSDAEVSRFLDACNGDIDAAAQRLAKRLRAEEPVAPDVARLSSALPLYARGLDRAGNHLFFFCMDDDLDVSVLNELGHGNVAAWVGAKLAEHLGADGRACLVVDMNHTSLFPLAAEVAAHVRTWLQTFMDQHPERLAQALVVNAPFAFSAASWPTLRRRMGARTSAKVRVLASCADLLAFVDESAVPGALGGKASALTASDLLWRAPLPSDSDELACLVRALKAALKRADVVEKETLQASVLARARLARPEAAASGEEAALREDLERAMDERDAYARAVRFARNFIEVGHAGKSDALGRLEAELQRVRRENALLADALEAAFGRAA